MRKLILPVLVVLCANASAQDKGFLSGTLSFDSRNDGEQTTIIAGPIVGFNLSPKDVIGLGLNVQSTEMESGDDYTSTATIFEVAPFYRYLKSVGEKCLIYGQLTAGYASGTSKSESDMGTTEYDVTAVRAQVAPGIIYVFADRWAVNADWGLLQYKTQSTDGEETSNEFLFKLNPGAIAFGLNWLF